MRDEPWFPTADCVASSVLCCMRDSCDDFKKIDIPKAYDVLPYMLNDPSRLDDTLENMRFEYSVYIEALTLPNVAAALKIAKMNQFVVHFSCSIQTGISSEDIQKLKKSRTTFLNELVDWQRVTALRILLLRDVGGHSDSIDNVIPLNLRRRL